MARVSLTAAGESARRRPRQAGMDSPVRLGYNRGVQMSDASLRSPGTPRLTAIDLFAGAGGLSYAFHTRGFDVLAAVELDHKAMETYETSFVNRHSPATRAIRGDVAAPETLDILREVTANRRLDVLIGGPPCQDFSPARLKREPVTGRASLVLTYIDLLRELTPRAFLFENVPGLLTADGGRHWDRLQRRLEHIGYTVQAREVYAEAFGVPQRRRRLVVVGLRESEPTSFTFPEGRDAHVTVGETFAEHARHLPHVEPGTHPPDDPNHRARRHRQETLDLLALIKPGESWREAYERGGRKLACHEGHNGHYDVYGRIDPTKIAPTMTGGCTNPSKGRFIHPEYHRGLTVREAALLQTFPPDWRFHGGIERESQQVGNAVPIRLGQALAEAVAETLDPLLLAPSHGDAEVIGPDP